MPNRLEFCEVVSVDTLIRYASMCWIDAGHNFSDDPVSDTEFLLHKMAAHDLVQLAIQIPEVMNVDVDIEEDLPFTNYTDTTEVIRLAFEKMVKESDPKKETVRHG